MHGKINEKVEVKDNTMTIDGKKISFFANKSPEEIPWDECGVDIVLESVLVSLLMQKRQKVT